MARFVRVGKVLKKKDGSGNFIKLGDPDAKKYAFTVELVVKDAKGEVVAKVENPFVNIKDPRENPNLTDEQKAKIPEFILKELTVVVNDEE